MKYLFVYTNIYTRKEILQDHLYREIKYIKSLDDDVDAILTLKELYSFINEEREELFKSDFDYVLSLQMIQEHFRRLNPLERRIEEIRKEFAIRENVLYYSPSDYRKAERLYIKRRLDGTIELYKT
ncbi:MAG: hypothetical protein ACTSX6_04555 [Candidatus Heimdallarchaeaceae archaeon]